jgi:hypothetical protein
MALSKNVFCCLGETVFRLVKARPSKPSVLARDVKAEETFLAASTAWFCTVTPPTDTVSVNTAPLEELPSPYLMDHEAPLICLAVELWLMLNMVWPWICDDGVKEEKTHRSDEPVSKSRFKVCGGVPICTGHRYSESNASGIAATSPVVRLEDAAREEEQRRLLALGSFAAVARAIRRLELLGQLL